MYIYLSVLLPQNFWRTVHTKAVHKSQPVLPPYKFSKNDISNIQWARLTMNEKLGGQILHGRTRKRLRKIECGSSRLHHHQPLSSTTEKYVLQQHPYPPNLTRSNRSIIPTVLCIITHHSFQYKDFRQTEEDCISSLLSYHKKPFIACSHKS